MEPRIQYAKTSDGVNIAYYAIGDGPPLVLMPGIPGSHLHMEWQTPAIRGAYELAARRWRVVRYDPRGFGLSDRGTTDFSVEALRRDLGAVADHLSLDRFRLFALGGMSAVAIAYAAQHPARVSHLALWLPMARGSAAPSVLDDLWALAEKDYDFFSEALARFGGFVEGESLQHHARQMRESASPETVLSFLRQLRKWDVTDLLPRLTMPTLVALRRQSRSAVDVARELASSIPGARLALFEGPLGFPDQEVQAAVAAFFADGEPRSLAEPEVPHGTAVILFTDIADSTALTERLGDAAFREKARDVAAALRSVIAKHGGRTIEGPTLGDGVLAVFTSATEAIGAAMACGKAGDEGGLPLHLGLHAGDVTREKDPDGRDNVYGGAVNIASRISGLSAAGEVLVSETVRSLGRTSAGVRFEDRGEQPLKGVGEPVRVWAVAHEEAS